VKPRHAHKVRTHYLVRGVARLMGRERRPDLDTVQSSLYPIINRDLPFWVWSNGTIWATSEDRADAIDFARRLAGTLQPWERVNVTLVGQTIFSSPGTADNG